LHLKHLEGIIEVPAGTAFSSIFFLKGGKISEDFHHGGATVPLAGFLYLSSPSGSSLTTLDPSSPDRLDTEQESIGIQPVPVQFY
jgi:hypothetical protein